MAATSPSIHRPASSCSTNSTHSPKTPSCSNTHHIPSSSSASSTPPPHPHPTSQHSYFPLQLPINSNINHRPSSSTQSSHPVSRSSSTTSTVSSLTTVSQSSQRPQSSQSHRTKHATQQPQKLNQFIMLQERPESFTLTSSLAPPSVIPMTAAGISSAKMSSSSSSRKSPADSLKLSMMVPPPSMAPITPTSNPASSTPVYTFSSHHQAYAHSLSAQQQLQLHQKEIIHQATRATGIPQHLLSTGPMSPRLIPLGSPGPVTPLTLEDGPDGFFSGSHGFGHQQLSQQLSIVASGQRGGL